ncbi:hypothetical protein BGX30_006426, partial [Mortierella sp. GBA39]
MVRNTKPHYGKVRPKPPLFVPAPDTLQLPPEDLKEAARPVPEIDIQAMREEAYRAGYTEGVEETVASHLPPYTVLPEIGAGEVIAAGLQ